MISIFQKTLQNKVSFSGVGLHSGKTSKINILPAEEDEGIVFKRVDLNKNNLIKANFANVSSAILCTTLENKYGIKVSTVEHLLAALYITGIDNATIEIDNDEVPIMDGSSKDFLDVLKKIKKKGLAKGGSLENAIVVDGDKVLNKDGLRNEKEFVNHKILDLAGDFMLSGYRIIGKVICHQGGHGLTNLFLRKIFNTKTVFEVIELSEFKVSKKINYKELDKIAVNA